MGRAPESQDDRDYYRNSAGSFRTLMNVEKKITAPIHRSLTHPVLLMGMARFPALMIFIMSAAILTSGLHWFTIGGAALLMIVGCYGVRQATDWSPRFMVELQRYARYPRVMAAETPLGANPWFRPAIFPSAKRPAVPTLKETGE